MLVYLAVSLSLLQGISQRGIKMVVSLSALSMGATSFQVGIIGALFALFPLFLAVTAGRLSDRIGVKRPIAGGAAMMALAILIPLAVPGLAGLMLCAVLVGLGHIFFHVSMHSLIGAYGEGEERTRNFATFSLGASVSAFIGPSVSGFSIDGLGFGPTHMILAAVSIAPAILVFAYPRLVPAHVAHPPQRKSAGTASLFAAPGLKRTLVMSGVTLTGIELFTFYFPVYGRSIGLTASSIGMVMASYAVAAFIVRMGMHRAARRVGDIGVLTASLFVAGATFLAVPFVKEAPLLGLVAFLLGLGLGCAQPLTILLTYNHAPPGRSGEALGMRLSVNKLTQILVPVVFGALGTALGLLAVFWANGAFLLAGGFVSLAERRVSSRKDAAAAIAEQEEEEDI
ncbi:MAG: MFS transporter [Usitatibacter sp.]